MSNTEFTKEELTFIQDTFNDLRAITFNELLYAKHRSFPTETLERDYQLIRVIRDKVYHLGGRDTLALAEGYHEQRPLDQKHDY